MSEEESEEGVLLSLVDLVVVGARVCTGECSIQVCCFFFEECLMIIVNSTL